MNKNFPVLFLSLFAGNVINGDILYGSAEDTLMALFKDPPS
jgi:hypothetical protein